jgi:hypothetical protein
VSIKAEPVSKGFGVAAGGKASAVRSPQVKPDIKTPDIKTKAELDYRQKQRTIPSPVLEPKSVTQRLSTLRQQSSSQNEDRITTLKNSLVKTGSNFRQQYRLSVLRGEAAAPTRSLQPKGRAK